MKSSLPLIALALFACQWTMVTSQASFDSIRLCTRPCSDGSSYTQCVDAFGSISSGDCTAPNAFPDCPTGNAGTIVYDLHAGDSSKPYWRSVSECNTYRLGLLQNPNLPAVVSPDFKYKKRAAATTEQQELFELLSARSEFTEYSSDEVERLSTLVRSTLSTSTKRAAFDINEVEILQAVHDFAQYTLKRTSTPGIYTNSKCAGCSTMIQGILEKGTSSACDAIVGTLPSTLCLATGPFAKFCDIFFKAGLALTGAEKTLTTMCTSALSGVATGSSTVSKAVELCSQLTCTTPQVSSPQSASQLVGSCTTNLLRGKTVNARCDEFLDLIACAKKGICIVDSTIKVINAFKSPVDATINFLGSLVTGKVSDVEASVQKLATGCNSGSKVVATLFVSVLVPLFVGGLLSDSFFQ